MYRILYRNRIWEDWTAEYFETQAQAVARKREIHYMDVPGKDRPARTFAVVELQRKHNLYGKEQWI